ncbi:MAG: saccharopine dehydrogenase family protein [Myxococcota bacterium]
MAGQPRVVFFGAAGYTGRLAARAAADRGMPFAIAGRDRARLEALRQELPGEPEVIVADARNPASLRDVARGASVVCSTAGPFTELGAPVVEACLEANAHYLDTTGEQRWVGACLDHYGDQAAERGVVLGPSMAYEVAVADCAAAVAARGMDQVEEVIIAYAVHRFDLSRGTKLSVLRAIQDPGWQWEAGARHPESPGSDVRHAVLPEPVGPRSLVLFSSPEAVTVPRHVRAERVRTYVAVHDKLGPMLALTAPRLPGLLSSPLGRWARSAVEHMPRGPEEQRRKSARSMVIAVARAKDGAARSVVVRLEDIYGLSAEILVIGASNLVDGGIEPGFRAPCEVAKDPAAFLQLLAARGARTEMVEADVLAGR